MQVITTHVEAPGMTLPVCLGPQLGKWNGLSSSHVVSFSPPCLILKEGQTGFLEMWQSPDSKSVKTKASCLPQALALEPPSISLTRGYSSKQAMRSAQTQWVRKGFHCLMGEALRHWTRFSIYPSYLPCPTHQHDVPWVVHHSNEACIYHVWRWFTVPWGHPS